MSLPRGPGPIRGVCFSLGARVHRNTGDDPRVHEREAVAFSAHRWNTAQPWKGHCSEGVAMETHLGDRAY